MPGDALPVAKIAINGNLATLSPGSPTLGLPASYAVSRARKLLSFEENFENSTLYDVANSRGCSVYIVRSGNLEMVRSYGRFGDGNGRVDTMFDEVVSRCESRYCLRRRYAKEEIM